MTTPLTLGIDFGTTNTVLALAGADGPARLIDFRAPQGDVFAYRSALSFHAPANAPSERTIAGGPWAIDAYLEDPFETRFIQSFKNFAASDTFSDTHILGRRYQFEDLLSAFLLRVWADAGLSASDLPKRVVVGRPVTFAGAAPDERLALKRYEAAFQRLGFEEILYAYEPVGAAFFFARDLQEDATILVGDFGGGTSDFSVIRFERRGGQVTSTPLGRSGVGVAGDAFDYRIIDNLVSPQLGKGSSYRSQGKTLPVPNRSFAAFARWDQLALMRGGKEMRDLRSLARDAVEPDKIERLIEILEENLGYRLYHSVSEFKKTMSAQDGAEFRFQAGSIDIRHAVDRAQFNSWIAPELAQIEQAVDAALAAAGLEPANIDRIFLTGGSSLVPAVRQIFQRRFDSARIESGAELESIALGLALMGREDDISRWTMRHNHADAT